MKVAISMTHSVREQTDAGLGEPRLSCQCNNQLGHRGSLDLLYTKLVAQGKQVFGAAMGLFCGLAYALCLTEVVSQSR